MDGMGLEEIALPEGWADDDIPHGIDALIADAEDESWALEESIFLVQPTETSMTTTSSHASSVLVCFIRSSLMYFGFCLVCDPENRGIPPYSFTPPTFTPLAKYFWMKG